jgi:hypothetical protein
MLVDVDGEHKHVASAWAVQSTNASRWLGRHTRERSCVRY